jgi:hypothetical protein
LTGLVLVFTQRDGVLNITIYEGIKYVHVMIPVLFHLECCVSLELKMLS